MTAPALQVVIQGQGSVSADNLNTYEQTCNNVTELRAFVGTPGVQVFLRGLSSPNDGGAGPFYWNAAGVGPDNGTTIIVPTGAATGCWTRILGLWGAHLFLVSQYGTLAATDAAAFTAGGVTIVDVNNTLLTNYTLTSKEIIFAGGIVTLGNFNLTWNNNAIAAGGVQIFNYNGSGAVLGSMVATEIVIDWWGTTSASIADTATTNAGNRALAYIAQSANLNAPLVCTKPNYYLSGSWIKQQSFNGPDFQGRGTTLHYSLSAAAAIVYIGGSGAISLAKISGFSFEGSATSWGIEMRGQDGVDITNCFFVTNAWGLVLHNFAANSFTEYVQWESCTFQSQCKRAWWYKITSGDQSFHGCGPRAGVTVNVPNPTAGSAVLLDANANVYNAPYNFQIWPQDNTTPIISTGAGTQFFAYGTITVENFSSGSPPVLSSPNSSNLLCGSVMSFGEGAESLGQLTLMNNFGIIITGEITGFMKPRRVSGVLPAGGGATAGIAVFKSQQFLCDLYITAPSYVYKYFVKTFSDEFGTNGLDVIATEISNNTAGYGAPTLGWNGTQITITNGAYPAATVSYTIGSIDIAGGAP